MLFYNLILMVTYKIHIDLSLSLLLLRVRVKVQIVVRGIVVFFFLSVSLVFFVGGVAEDVPVPGGFQRRRAG